MKRVILSAGISRRLFPSTRELPKCLLPLAGKAILDFQLSALRQAGITDVAMVVGYRREQIMAAALDRYPEMNFAFIINHHFFDTNTAYSLWLARDYFRGEDFLYLNGDVVFPPKLLTKLLDSDQSVSLAVEHKICGDEEVKVVVQSEDQRIIDIGKEIAPATALGEFIGVAEFSAEFSYPYIDSLQEIVGAGINSAYFEYALKKLAGSHPLYSLDITEIPCVEVDFPEDLERAHRLARDF